MKPLHRKPVHRNCRITEGDPTLKAASTWGDELGHRHFEPGAVGRDARFAAPRPLARRRKVVLHDTLSVRSLAHQCRPAPLVASV